MKVLHASDLYLHMPWRSIFNISWFNKSEWIFKRAHLTPKHTMTLIWSLLLLAASCWYFWCGCWMLIPRPMPLSSPIVSLSISKLFAFFAPIWNTAFFTKASCRWKGFSIICKERNYAIVRFWKNMNTSVTYTIKEYFQFENKLQPDRISERKILIFVEFKSAQFLKQH